MLQQLVRLLLEQVVLVDKADSLLLKVMSVTVAHMVARVDQVHLKTANEAVTVVMVLFVLFGVVEDHTQVTRHKD
jgi:uncharacterized membrane protein